MSSILSDPVFFGQTARGFPVLEVVIQKMPLTDPPQWSKYMTIGHI